MPLVTFLLNLSVTLLKEFPHSLSYSVNRSLICINSMFGCNIQFSLTQCTTNEIKEAFKRIVWSSFLFRQVIVGQKCLYFCVDAPQWYQRASSTLQMGVGQSLILVCLFVYVFALGFGSFLLNILLPGYIPLCKWGESWFSPLIWVPGFELTSSGLTPSTGIQYAIFPAPDFGFSEQEK